jgi:hypothetical protein
MAKSEWVWCRRCKRCYEVGKDRWVDDRLTFCAYEDCDGAFGWDDLPWCTLRFEHPEYPAEPVFGQVYEGTFFDLDYRNTPRNARCPCGSGKKFKQCHGRHA